MSTIAGRNHQILIVDDEEGLRDLHQDNLEEAGFICFTAPDGFEALEVLAIEAIDLAVIDVMMPRMSGLELFEQIRELYPWVAVLFITGVDQMDVAVSKVKKGALDYLIKPVTRAKLIGAVNEGLVKQNEFLDDSDHRRHLEDLLVHQSRALENKVREVRALTRMFLEMKRTLAAAQEGVSLQK